MGCEGKGELCEFLDKDQLARAVDVRIVSESEILSGMLDGVRVLAGEPEPGEPGNKEPRI